MSDLSKSFHIIVGGQQHKERIEAVHVLDEIVLDVVGAFREIYEDIALIFVLPNSSQIVDLPIRPAPSIMKAFLPFSSFFRVNSLSYIFRFSIIITLYTPQYAGLYVANIPEYAH